MLSQNQGMVVYTEPGIVYRGVSMLALGALVDSTQGYWQLCNIALSMYSNKVTRIHAAKPSRDAPLLALVAFGS